MGLCPSWMRMYAWMDRFVYFGTVVAVSHLPGMLHRRRQQPGPLRSVPFQVAILSCCADMLRVFVLQGFHSLDDFFFLQLIIIVVVASIAICSLALHASSTISR